MSRVIMSVQSTDDKAIEVTPEAINRFYVRPVELDQRDNSDSSCHIEVKLQACVEKEEPVILTLTETSSGKQAQVSFDEKAFAENMIAAIVTNHGDIDDMTMLKDGIKEATADLTYEIWKNDGIAYDGLRIPGFGFIEANNEVVAVVGGIYFNNRVEIYAVNGTDISSYRNLGKGHLHFLPEGKDRFLVFDMDVAASNGLNGEKEFLLETKTLPAPSKEVPAGEIPKDLSEYESMDKYLEAVTAYIEKHMGVGNDRRVELEDDLIF